MSFQLLMIAVAAVPLVIAFGIRGFQKPIQVLLPAFAAFVPYGSAVAVPGLPPRYASVSSLLLIALVVCMTVAFASGRWKIDQVPIAAAVWLLLLGVTGATILWSMDTPETAVYFLSLVGLVVLYVLVLVSPVDQVAVHRVETALMIGGGVGSLYAILQAVTGTLPTTAEGGATRFGDDLTGPNHLAAALTLPLAVALGKLTRPESRLSRLMTISVATALAAAILLTASRGGILAAVVVAVVVVAASGQGRRRVVSTIAVGGVTLILAANVTTVTLDDRLLSSDSNNRTDIWSVGAAACVEHCLIGSGWGTFGLVYAENLPSVPNAEVSLRNAFYEPHNIWLQLAVETGLTSVLLVAVGLVIALRQAIRLPDSVRGPPLAALLALLLTSFLLGSFEYKYFWMVLIYVAMVDRSGVGKRSPHEDPEPERAYLPRRVARRG